MTETHTQTLSWRGLEDLGTECEYFNGTLTHVFDPLSEQEHTFIRSKESLSTNIV
jgi:hypothetical protein